MEKLSIEQKAERYESALERCRKLYKEAIANEYTSDIEDYETIFPELKESQDELTWLTKYIEEEAYSLSMDIRDNEDRIKLKNLQKALAWLEKQLFKPKFKVGQIIYKPNFNKSFTIAKIEDGYYYNTEGDCFPITDEDNWLDEKVVIYCDLPSTKKYETDFDNDAFWEWARKMSKEGHYVYVSEYEAPSDFKCIWQMKKKDGMGTTKTGGKQNIKVEKLFVYDRD